MRCCMQARDVGRLHRIEEKMNDATLKHLFIYCKLQYLKVLHHQMALCLDYYFSLFHPPVNLLTTPPFSSVQLLCL